MPTSGAFAAAGDRWTFSGALTFDDATAVLEPPSALPLPASGVVDMAGLAHADSAALAVLLALRRRATAEGASRCPSSALPPMLDSLARVYGIEDLHQSLRPGRARERQPSDADLTCHAVEVIDVARRFGTVQALAGVDLDGRARASSSGCSGPTAPARPR